MGRNKAPSENTVRMLCSKSAGMCEFEGCNKRLFFDGIANTIIPWTIEWLYYYELWLATGEWLGGGDHPEIGKPKTEDTSENR